MFVPCFFMQYIRISFAIISLLKVKELAAIRYVSSCCYVATSGRSVFLLMVMWLGRQCMIGVKLTSVMYVEIQN